MSTHQTECMNNISSYQINGTGVQTSASQVYKTITYEARLAFSSKSRTKGFQYISLNDLSIRRLRNRYIYNLKYNIGENGKRKLITKKKKKEEESVQGKAPVQHQLLD